MKKKLLTVGVAATLGALAGVSNAAIWGPGAGQTPVGRVSGVWADGGRSRSRGHRSRIHQSPAERVAERAKARRQGGGA